MEIKGLAKTTLLDYPGHVAATIFTGGCDFACPFCHNKTLVTHPERLASIDMDELYAFLEQRKVALEGICITGGEPLLQKDLMDFLRRVKEMGYKIKLDTNGYEPTHLSHILNEHLVDYVAMDIKNCQAKYAKTAGLPYLDLTRVKLSVDLIKDCDIDYEFRTTVAKELHQWEDIESIGQWLYGAKNYYLQPYVESDDVIMPVFSSYSKKEMQQMKQMLSLYVKHADIRGFA